MGLFGPATQALTRARLTEATYDADGTTVEKVPCVFSWAYSEVRGAQGPAISSRRPTLFIAFDDLPVPPAYGHGVDVAGKSWTVVKVQENAENTGADLMLKEA